MLQTMHPKIAELLKNYGLWVRALPRSFSLLAPETSSKRILSSEWGKGFADQGGGGKVAMIRKGYETARCRVFRWGLGGGGAKKCNDIFKNSLSPHTKDWGRGGNNEGVFNTQALWNCKVPICWGRGEYKTTYLSFFLSLFFFFCWHQWKSIAIKRIQFTQGKRVAPTPQTHKSNQWKSNHGG